LQATLIKPASVETLRMANKAPSTSGSAFARIVTDLEGNTRASRMRGAAEVEFK
jgi:hypothetical protein